MSKPRVVKKRVSKKRTASTASNVRPAAGKNTHDTISAPTPSSASGSERLQKALARMGVGSRREIERLVTENKIRINGQPAKLGDHVKAGDKVNVGDRRYVIQSELNRIRVLMYHKPEGEVCTRKDEEGRKTVFDSIGRINQGRWINVGRLDINSSGLLLFTNDGELANHLMHPSSEIEREYAVRVNGEVTDVALNNMLKGVNVDGELLKFDYIEYSGGQGKNHWYHVILREGKNREVRRLWQSQDVMVSRLTRVRYGNLVLPRSMKAGQKYEFGLDEVKALYQDVGLKWTREEKNTHKKTGKRSGQVPGQNSSQKGNLRNKKRSVQSKRK